MSAASVSTEINSARQPVREWAMAALVAFGVAMVIVTPFFFLGTASGHDVSFHMSSWLDAAQQWKQGVVFPRWTEWSNFGFGEPRFIFYPPLSWLVGALLGTMIPWQAVAGVFIVAVQVFAGISAYALSRRLVESRFAALLGATCFAANPYSLLIIYARSDFAELLAIAFFPVLFLATLRLGAFLEAEELIPARKIVLFAIAFSAVWLCNAPAGVIATYSVAILFVLAAVRQGSAAPLTSGFAGMVLGFGISSFYLIPAIYEQRWVNISGILSGGLKPAENFLYAKTSDMEHDAFNRMASNVALLLIFWAVCSAVVAWRMQRSAGSSERWRFLFPSSLLGIVAIVLMFPITNIFWKFVPELRFLQFPWRWMSIVAVCAMIFTGASARGWLRWGWPVIAMAAILGCGHYVVKHSWWDSDDMPSLQAAINDGSGFEGTDEYDPVGDDRTDLPQKAPRAAFIATSIATPPDGRAKNDAKILIERWMAEHRVVKVVTAKKGQLALRLVDYPAWRVLLNGNRAQVQHPNGTRQIIVSIPAGESEVRIDFTRTADRTLGGVISIFSVVCAIIVWSWPRRSAGVATLR